ncbi:MAG TPA: lipoyl synthase, partial [Phenylobacterium sp.]
MAVVIDNLNGALRPRHPEKQANPETPLLRKPEWLRVRAPGSPGYNATREIVKNHGLITVCEEAACPNIG